MKIAECNETFLPVVDGVATVTLAYCNTLSKRGHEVYAIVPLSDTGFRGKYPFEIVDFNAVKVSKKLPWRLGLESLDTHFANRIKMIDFDIVHVHSPGIAGMAGIKIARKKHIPVIGSFHSKYYDDILKIVHLKPLAKLGAKIIADFYERCDEVWAVSEHAAEALRSYGYKGEIVVMQNGTNVRELNEARIPEVRGKYGIRKDVPMFLYVGQINWKKNLECVLKTCEILKNNGLDFQLVLAGRGPDERAVQKLANRLGLKDNLIMTGHLYDTELLDILYHLASLFLLPSPYDTSSMVLREAAAMYTPSIVLEETGPSEIVQDGKNSFLCKNDPKDMADKIMRFQQMTKSQKNAIKKKAHDTIPIPWDGPLMDEILERYQRLIDEKKR